MRLSSKVLIAVILLTLGLLALKGWKESLREEGRHEVREQVRQQVEADAQRMREVQRAAELRYVVKREAQDRYFVETVREVHDAAAPLAACPLPDSLRVRVNDAIACAVGDSASPCGAAGEVPGASGPAGRSGSQ